MTRSLRILKPKLPSFFRKSLNSTTSAMFWCGMVAVLLQTFVPYVVLGTVGIEASTIKVHPSTELVIICGIYALAQGGVPFHTRCREEPGLLLYIFGIPVIVLYSVCFTGVSGAAIYIDTFWSAGFLAVLLGRASPREKRILARILIAVCVINVFIGLYENATATNWFQPRIDPDAPLEESAENFRANAFFGHPLTAALVTSMAVFLLFSMRMQLLLRAPIFCLFLVGLFAYGGRTALGLTLFMCLLTAGYLLLSGILQRNLSLEFVVVMVAGAIIIPLIIYGVVTQTSIADRIMDTLYFDDSAKVRTLQWQIFRYISLNNWLFGITHDDLNLLKYQIGLGGLDTDIENFWILIFLNLGSLGFLVFLVLFALFLVHLGRQPNTLYGWLLVISALIIDSGSNSLGSKTVDLFLEVAFLIAMSGYNNYAPKPLSMFSAIRGRLNPSEQSISSLGQAPTGKARGLRILGSRQG